MKLSTILLRETVAIFTDCEIVNYLIKKNQKEALKIEWDEKLIDDVEL